MILCLRTNDPSLDYGQFDEVKWHVTKTKSSYNYFVQTNKNVVKKWYMVSITKNITHIKIVNSHEVTVGCSFANICIPSNNITTKDK